MFIIIMMRRFQNRSIIKMIMDPEMLMQELSCRQQVVHIISPIYMCQVAMSWQCVKLEVL